MDSRRALMGTRTVLKRGTSFYPDAFNCIPEPPRELYVVGNAEVLFMPAIAVVGARKATPYGRGCAERFSRLAAERGIAVVSGGARGCDSVAHRAALDAGGKTVVFLGGGANELYPVENHALFQKVVDAGGAVVSEHPWDFKPLPYTFRARNRLIAGLSSATLIVEAGLPSGTFSTADEALAAGKEVLAVPGAITSSASLGANKLIAQGATPIVDDESFLDALFSLFGTLRQEQMDVSDLSAEGQGESKNVLEMGHNVFDFSGDARDKVLLQALYAEPLSMEALRTAVLKSPEFAGEDKGETWGWLMIRLAEFERMGAVARYPDGRFGPVVHGRNEKLTGHSGSAR